MWMCLQVVAAGILVSANAVLHHYVMHTHGQPMYSRAEHASTSYCVHARADS